MEIREHTVSLDLALELRDAGYPQENALFYWYRQEEYYGAGVLQPAGEPFLDRYEAEPSFPIKRLAAAPLASELGEVLPDKFKSRKLGPAWWCWMPNDSASSVRAVTEPNARAEMWLHLRKASLI